jgi:two-component system, cell cycle response regulator
VKILIADDEPLSRCVLQRLLTKWGYEVVSAEDGNAAWRILQAPDAPRIALIDWMMPGRDGADVCRELRSQRPQPYTYILLISAIDAKDKIVEGLESGADDYLTKPFHPQELKARLRVGLRLLELEDTLIHAREAMRFKATHDMLTDVWNRGAILEIFDREMTRCRRECTSLGVLMVDLDHFKAINDTHGHLTGDSVLREVSRRMLAEIRSYDSLGRYGGEEFLVLLPGCQAADTVHKAEQLRLSLLGHPIDTPTGPVSVTISVGGVSVANWPSDDLNQILQMADAAMYRAKTGGRNHVVMADTSDHESSRKSVLEYSELGPAKD